MSNQIEVQPVESRRELRRFVAFPLDLYRNYPHYVPNLNSDELATLDAAKNAAFEFCRARLWLARRNGEVVGRIAGIINDRYRERWGKEHARFGWVDFVDDREVSSALFGACERWAREAGMTALHGPLGFTDLDPEGMLIDGFEETGTLATIYNYPYYPDHLGSLGFSRDADWLEYSVSVPEALPEKIRKVAEMVSRRTKLHVVELTHRRQVLAYAREIFEVLNQAYSGLYAVTELSEHQIDAYIKQYFGFIHKDFVPIVVDEDDHVVAFAIAMPSLSGALRKAWGRLLPTGGFHLFRALASPRTIDLYLVGVRPDYQGRGVNSLLITAMFESCRKHGVLLAEAHPQLESNRMVQAFWRYFDFRQHKRRRVFIKEL